MSNPKNIVLLGATGSIGDSTIRVIEKNPTRLKLIAIAGRRRWRELAIIATKFEIKHVGIFDEAAYQEAVKDKAFDSSTQLYCGLDGLVELATLEAADTVVDAVVGTLSLQPALAALEKGKDLALASKEILVMAGKFVTEVAKRNNCQILPLDSEHNAIFQCLQGEPHKAVASIILTASGGPFRNHSIEQMKHVTLEDALKHPNWDMGPKVTIDSSTMANKGLEIIEAHWLFDMSREQIEVVIHPQSIIHSMVRFIDGSIVAHLSPPIMTFAIQHSLLYPDRTPGVDTSIDFSQALSLDFQPPDYQRFPCLKHALDAMELGGVAPAVFNASNEVAVEAFVNKEIGYQDIPKIIAQTLEKVPSQEPDKLEQILAADAEARRVANEVKKILH